MGRVFVRAETAGGFIYGNNAVYATAHTTSTGLVDDTYIWVGQRISSDYWVYRTFLSFDTDGLVPDGAEVLRATLWLKGEADNSTTDFNVQIWRCAWTETLAANREANWDIGHQSPSVLEGTLCNTSAFSVGGWQHFALDPRQIVLDGDSKYSVISEEDENASVPGGDEYVSFYSGDAADAANAPFLEIVYHFPRAHSHYSAPGVPPRIYAFDRNDDPIDDLNRALELRQGLQYSTVAPGGFKQCTWDMPLAWGMHPLWRVAWRVEVRCGMENAWDGRVAGIRRASNGKASLTAMGGFTHLTQMDLDETPAATETGQTVVERVLSQCPLIAPNYRDVGDPGLDLEGKSWDDEKASDILLDVGELGDTEDPPRLWYPYVWERDEEPDEGSADISITANGDDAYDDGAVCTHNDTVLRIGESGGTIYTTGFIFRGVDIPQYAKILTATITMRSKGDLGADEPMEAYIYCERDLSPSDWTARLPSNATLSFAREYWSQDWPVDGTDVTTDDFAEVVQEIVNMGFVSDLSVIIMGINVAGDTRKQIEALEHADANEAEINLTWGPTGEMVWGFHPEFSLRTPNDFESVDYVVMPEDVADAMEYEETDDDLVNVVRASYGGGSVTSEATDQDSIDEFDRRETVIAAGDDADSTQAENFRDAHLDAHKAERRKSNSINLHSIRDVNGIRVNPAMVRAGCVVRFDLGETDPDDPLLAFVVETQYDADQGVLSVTPDMPREQLDILLARAQNG